MSAPVLPRSHTSDPDMPADIRKNIEAMAAENEEGRAMLAGLDPGNPDHQLLLHVVAEQRAFDRAMATFIEAAGGV